MIQTFSKNSSPNKLYASGRLSILMDFVQTARGFYPIQTFDMRQFDKKRLSIFVFGQVNDDFSGANPQTQNYVLQPHASAAFYYNSVSGGSRADADFQLVGGMLSIGIRNTHDVSETPIAPFFTAVVDYFIFLL